MPVYVSTLPQDKNFEINLEELKKFAKKLLEAVGRKDLELSLVFTDDETIKALNREWRQKDKPTDVLSFPQDFPDRSFRRDSNTPEEDLKGALEQCKNCRVLGDIVISVDTARRQAEDFGWSLEDELKRLILHGFVHLLGFDHEKSSFDEERFRRLEELLLDRIGHGKPLKGF